MLTSPRPCCSRNSQPSARCSRFASAATSSLAAHWATPTSTSNNQPMVSNQDFSHSTVQSRPCALSTSTIFVFAFLAFLRPLEIGLRWFCGRKMHFGALSHGRQISSRPPLSNGIHNLFSSPTQAHRVLFQRRLASPACVGAFYAKFYFFALLEVKVMFNVEEKNMKIIK